MATENGDRSREDATEEPSTHRIEEFRKQGRVAQSRELTSIVGLLAAGVAFYAVAPQASLEFAQAVKSIFTQDWSIRKLDVGMISAQSLTMGKLFLKISLPIALAGFFIALMANFIQVGPIFSADPISPDWGRINPIAGLQRLFSLKHLYESLRLIVRGAVVILIAYWLLKDRVLGVNSWILIDPNALPGYLADDSRTIFLTLAIVLTIFASIDYGLQRFEFGKSIRLTKQEAKEEHKETEGDPLIRARIRSIQRDQARKRMMEAVKTADVVVTNPTHLAIALVYDKSKMDAPKVVAKGADFLAQKIKKIAAEAGVPLVENVTLARALFKSVKIGRSVPRALYQAVAEILAYVYRLKQRGL